MSDFITVTKGKEEMRVRPRGLDALLAKGWTLLGANQETPQSQVVGAIPPKKTRKKVNA